MSRRPYNWPKGFIYIRESFSPELHPTLIANFLSTGNPEDENQRIPILDEAKVHPDIKIKKIGTPHPLSGQRGVFASALISAGTDLGEYAGEIRLIEQSWKLNPELYDYAWTLKMGSFFLIIDAKKWANEFAFVNDYRGIAAHPNVESKWVVHRGVYRLIFRTVVDLYKGQELLIDYGEEYWKAPHRSLDFFRNQIFEV